jgi:DNA-binding MarR family transcriptional regulator
MAVGDLGQASNRFAEAAARSLGLAVSDVVVLSHLRTGGPLGVGQLSEVTGLSSGAVTGIADRLERAGYVRRRRDPTDRRRVAISLRADRRGSLVRVDAELDLSLRALGAILSDGESAFIAGFLREASMVFRAEAERLKAAGLRRRPRA